MVSATLDTNVFPAEELISRAQEAGIEVAVISVSRREAEGSSVNDEIKNLREIPEIAVWGESPWGRAVWGGQEDGYLFERALTIVSSGSFPPSGSRGDLSRGQQRQMRDAMILAAHVRGGRGILVSEDRRAFISQGRRKLIEDEFKTCVMTVDEFGQYLASIEGGVD